MITYWLSTAHRETLCSIIVTVCCGIATDNMHKAIIAAVTSKKQA